VESISELRERYQPKIEILKKKLATPPAKTIPHKASSISSATRPSSIPPAVTPIKTLSSYVDVEKLRKHTDSKEIELIWRAGHTKDSLICAVIPKGIYTRMVSLAREHPMFILPLPRENGVEMHFMQFKFPEAKVSHILFTSLLEYKTHGEFARPHTTVMHFEDLAEEKGIVLMRGEIDNGHGMDLEDARMLMIGVQKLFGAEASSERGKIRRALIEKFSKGSEEFDVNELMDELNRIE
jgi:ATP synthase mitochondrial F1 complex assembly factor 1